MGGFCIHPSDPFLLHIVLRKEGSSLFYYSRKLFAKHSEPFNATTLSFRLT